MLGKSHKAISYYKKGLEIALELKDKTREGRVYCNLGNAYRDLREYLQAEECLWKSIKINVFLQHNAKKAQWQITLFEELVKPYIGLEKVSLLQEKKAQALEISDARRSRALSFLLSQKLSSKENQDFSSNLLSLEEIQKLAEKLSTTFVTYSLTQFNAEKPPIQVWIISSKGKMPQSISLPIPEDTFSKLDLIFKAFPYQLDAKRPTRGEKKPNQLFHEKLSVWYDLLINPLEGYLPSPNSEETLTFIPDGFLAHLPFGAFYNTKTNRYLIESYPISVAPSMQVLSLLDQLPKELSSQTLLMGNPTTPHEKDNHLEHAEREVKDIILPMMKSFENKLCIQKKATVESVFQHAPNARVIHIACHGVAEEKPQDDPYSVFEGFFKLAPDMKHSRGELHAKEVNSLSLKADLVFMSACHLGRGNLQKEGSIGPIWSFLGAGAKSTVASYWPLPEGEMTVKMVETFYKHYLGIGTPKLDKAKALQRAILMAMKTERDNPRQWGSFFLSGFIE
ncbi:CHAT domain-containing protein [Rhabdochlamydiaceae symbiont of Dictyostelium giganteum]|uniref:CHAT domain-containing protein n=1 Tax=Rhabdochlamydiaceae symbiont of Dictyostelium giganteum TaxID=3342349 RepID=UPI00384D88CA